MNSYRFLACWWRTAKLRHTFNSHDYNMLGKIIFHVCRKNSGSSAAVLEKNCIAGEERQVLSAML